MKSILVLFTLLFTSTWALAQAQSGTVQLQWLEPIPTGPEGETFLPSLKAADMHPDYYGLPQFCAALPAEFRASDSVQLRVLSSELVPNREKWVLRNIELPSKEALLYQNYAGYSRTASRISYCLIPFYKEGNQVYRITQLQWQVLKGQRKPEAPLIRRAKNLANSQLSTGKWHKLRISESGIYKLTPDFFNQHKIGDGDVKIASIRLLANDQAMLPESFNAARTIDLQERSFKAVDANNDGDFNNNDYILFYAYGPHDWTYNSSGDRFDYRHNIYRDHNFVFVSVDAGNAKSMETMNLPSNPQQVISSFDDFDAVEEDLVNLVGTGRAWYGDIFEFTLSYNYNFSFPNLVLAEAVKIRVDAVGRASTGGTSLNTRYANQTVMSNGISAYETSGDYPAFVQRADQRGTFTAQASNLTLNLTYDNSANPTGVAWLDKIELNVRRALNFAGAGNMIQFRDSRSLAAGAVGTFRIENPPNDITVWQINRLGEHQYVPGAFNGSGIYEFNADLSELNEYVAFTGTNFDAPAYIGLIENQDLHAMTVPEMVIISHPNFLESAQELADFHNGSDNVATAVVSTEEIYNEYGSGGQDLSAVRDFIKDLYDRSQNDQFKYVLLFGDASYDYKDRITGNNNFVPTWESSYSYSLGLSSITDDFFAYMDPGEATNFQGAIMDLGIGRITVSTAAEARNYVNKVKNYVEGTGRFGEWRSRVLLMSDDVDLGWERTYFVPRSENLYNLTKRASNAFNVQKIYQDAYQQQTSTGSQSYPEAQRDMFRAVQRGCLLVNYIGHGGEIGLASEKLLQLSDVNGWTNYDALPLFITITCEFTRYDDPKRVSAGEQLLLNPRGGAVALLSTTRVVGVQGAVDLNEAIFDTILARPNGVPQTLGQIFRAAKNDDFVRSRNTKTKFSLVGDPALRLAIPEYGVELTDFNAVDIALAQDTIKALSLVELDGQVVDLNGQLMNDFNGILNISVFDKETQRQTLVNDGVGSPVNFQERNSLIYRGKVEVNNGLWTVQFRAPLGINYQFGFGKVSMYAYDAVNDRDAAGAYDSILVGGFNENAPADEEGPEIQLFMNDASFVRGGITGSDPYIYAELRDSSGINTVGNGIGQDLRAVLNKASDQPYILNEYYEADLNSYKSGSLRYQLFDLEPGSYQLDLRAFDIYNNPSEATTEFVVAESADLALERVLNYPNPFTTYTEFQFEHNRANQPLEVQVQIFTVSGKLVKTINQEVLSAGNRVTGISWNGLDDYGDKIGKGVYVYRVKVRSLSDNSSADVYEKLVVLR
ncbi:type IX secretion system sortase PorU [Croceimicrobium hydrocarbonivorans]|uniref:Type IX secretion system sortase PorU n=1 Tax=Croceimicrobium hydrocarbonivorans TaxID=2761580 RepID=A0A7H0VH85_9FLAO|nr:type IX secretion system sortase PorU [Croceimicrobium hydrocarbonivorans]QNR25083.1 type IX secretion system sortase PorU [Croceimicrobium hydrocarbonivorans]